MNKLYVLIRKDLPAAYQAVQGGHALAEWLLRGPSCDWNNNTLIYLGVPDEKELLKLGDKLTDRGIGWVKFQEPDIDNETTAIASYGDGKVFSNLKLL